MTAWMSNANKRRKARADGIQALCDWIAGRAPKQQYYEFSSGRRITFFREPSVSYRGVNQEPPIIYDEVDDFTAEDVERLRGRR